ncbi:MAG: hypothetical protein HFJ45_05410 [Clostridia bacterium]|nr:hypothetical protein [Clostridia bacterium]
MSEQISQELLRIIDEINSIDGMISKIDAAIFVRKTNKIIKDKIACLYDILYTKANVYSQNRENFYENIELIVSHYKQKLNMLYDETYCQYVNVQNELQEAKLKKNIVMVNYQKTINDKEEDLNLDKDLIKSKKNILKSKNEKYINAIKKCEEKLKNCAENFEKKVNDDFIIISNLQECEKNNIIQKIKFKIINIFVGNKKYKEVLEDYNKIVNKIDAQDIVNKIREDTIDFVTEILELTEIKDKNIVEVG